jgi:hypothetical protein
MVENVNAKYLLGFLYLDGEGRGQLARIHTTLNTQCAQFIYSANNIFSFDIFYERLNDTIQPIFSPRPPG